MIGAIVLAAGGSSRLGRPKQFLIYREETLVHRTARLALASGCGTVVVVSGRDHETLKEELSDLNASLVHNENWSAGIGSSIRSGMQEILSLQPELEAVMILVCDQPYLNQKILRSLITARARSKKWASACSYAETVGVPALFGRVLFSFLSRLSDSQGAKYILASIANEVEAVPFPKGAVDIDTPEDCQRLRLLPTT